MKLGKRRFVIITSGHNFHQVKAKIDGKESISQYQKAAFFLQRKGVKEHHKALLTVLDHKIHPKYDGKDDAYKSGADIALAVVEMVST